MQLDGRDVEPMSKCLPTHRRRIADSKAFCRHIYDVSVQADIPPFSYLANTKLADCTTILYVFKNNVKKTVHVAESSPASTHISAITNK